MSIQKPAQPRGQVLLAIFHNRGQVLAQVNGLHREGDAALQPRTLSFGEDEEDLYTEFLDTLLRD